MVCLSILSVVIGVIVGCGDDPKTAVNNGTQPSAGDDSQVLKETPKPDVCERAEIGRTITLPPGIKLMDIGWKEMHMGSTELWILTRQMRKEELPETHTFSEGSFPNCVGEPVHGEITIVEQR